MSYIIHWLLELLSLEFVRQHDTLDLVPVQICNQQNFI